MRATSVIAIAGLCVAPVLTAPLGYSIERPDLARRVVCDRALKPGAPTSCPPLSPTFITPAGLTAALGQYGKQQRATDAEPQRRLNCARSLGSASCPPLVPSIASEIIPNTIAQYYKQHQRNADDQLGRRVVCDRSLKLGALNSCPPPLIGVAPSIFETAINAKHQRDSSGDGDDTWGDEEARLIGAGARRRAGVQRREAALRAECALVAVARELAGGLDALD